MMPVALTTSDNPYSPFDQWDQWYQFDESHGYHSCSLLARIAKDSYGLPPDENDRIVEEAIDLIVERLPLHSADSNAFYVKAINGRTRFPIAVGSAVI